MSDYIFYLIVLMLVTPYGLVFINQTIKEIKTWTRLRKSNSSQKHINAQTGVVLLMSTLSVFMFWLWWFLIFVKLH